MQTIQGVSLPRSGHNLLVSHLQSYFGSQDICTSPRGPRLSLSFLPRSAPAAARLSTNRFHYCEYYYSCRCRPCRNPGNVFQKSHDFKLDLPVNAEQKHLVQTRDAPGVMISWFELRLAKGREIDTADGFRDFVRRHRDYIDGFFRKWVQADIGPRLMLDYDEYLSRPIEWLSQVILFFDPECTVDQQRIREIVSDIRRPRIDHQFRFYNALADEVGV